MADKFVWSGATGANDGSSWADAYTSLMRDWGAEAGFTPGTDYIYVRSVHAESAAATLTITGTTPESTEAVARVLSVVGDTTGTTPGNLAAGASVTTTLTNTDIVFQERLYIYGVDFHTGDDITFGTASDSDIHLEQCTLDFDGVSGGDVLTIGGTGAAGARTVWTNVSVTFGDAAQGFLLQAGTFFWSGGSVTTNTTTLFETVNVRPVQMMAVGVDLSAVSGNLFSGTTFASDVTLKLARCLLHASATIISGTIDVPGANIETYHCQAGTDADPAYQMHVESARGRVSVSTTRYRTGGASDGERTNPVSWDLDTTVGSVRGYPGHALVSPPIVGWTDGDGSTAHTYRIYFASDATINNDELWVEFVGPNDAATNSLGATKTNRVAPRTTASAHTTDSGSTWNGSGVTTKQYMDISYTPDKPGPIEARIHMAKASDNIYVDPKIYIDP